MKKVALLGLVLFMAFTTIIQFPAYAGEVWSQYNRIAIVPSSALGGFNSPRSVAMDGSGNVYVADEANHRVQKLTAATGHWSQWGKEGGASGSDLGEFEYPSAVAVDENGNVYVADMSNNRIQKLTVSTGVWSEWGKGGGASGYALGEFNLPIGVAVDGSGNVYVADFSNHRVQKWTAGSDSWSEVGAGRFHNPGAVAVDAAGNVYVADTGHHRIHKMSATDNSWTVWGTASGVIGNELGEFSYPFGLAVDASGNNVYVADSANNRIQRLAVADNQWTAWGKSDKSSGTELGEFSNPFGMAVDASGENVYVADRDNNRIQKLHVGSNKWTQYGTSGNAIGSELGQFSNPYGISTDGSGNVYVADRSNHRIQKLDAASGAWSEWKKSGGGYGTAPGEFLGPSDVAADNDGNLFVVEEGNNRMQSYSVSTGGWTVWTSGTGTFNRPKGIAIDASGNVYVADTLNNRIQILALSTSAWSEWGISGGLSGSEPGQFNQPSGVAADRDGNVYVADTKNHRIQKFTASTQQWSEWGKPAGGAGNGLGEFDSPGDVSVDAEGNVWVADTNNNRIQKLTASTGSWSQWGTGGSGLGQFNNPGSAAADGKGNVFVTDTLNHRIQKLSILPDEPESPPPQSYSPPSAEASGGADIYVNGKAERAGTVTVKVRDGRKITTIAVDSDKLDKKLASEGQGAVITIPASGISDVFIAELSGRSVQRMLNKDATLNVVTERGSYSLPIARINVDRIADPNGSAISLEDIAMQIEISPSTANMTQTAENAASAGSFSIVGSPIGFAVRAVNGHSGIEISKFNVYVERTIVLPDGIDPGKITTGIVVDQDGTVRHVPTKIVETDGKLVAQINSLTNSTYAIIYHPMAFGDAANHWAQDAIDDLGSRMVVEGTGNALFQPDRSITRAEFAAIVVRGLGLKPASGATAFTDVSAEQWYSGSINAAHSYRLISGMTDGSFRPDERITREQAIAIIARAMELTGLKGSDLPAAASDEALRPYADAGEVSDWARSSVADGLRAAVVTGKGNGKLAPKSYVTRAELAVLVQRLLKNSGLI